VRTLSNGCRRRSLTRIRTAGGPAATWG